MMQIICSHTNAYAEMKNAGTGRPWERLTLNELQCFIGICLYVGLFYCPRLEDYWNTNRDTPTFFFTSHMTLLRFQQIKRYLHVCDIEGDNGKSFFFNKIEPLFSHFVSVSKQLWHPSSFVSCDEMMVMNFGRSSETVRMKNKPIGSGYKIWSLCDSGYISHAFPHSNKNPWKHCFAYKRELPHSSAVVATLADSLPRTIHYGKSTLSKMYAVFMDNLFSTPKLFRMLREKDIGAVGTVRSSAKGLPKGLAVRGGEDKKLDWNTLGAALCESDLVLALTWIDNGAVQMLTTLHNVGNDHTVERSRKRPRLTSTNGKRFREVFGNESVKKLHIPKVIDDYNYNMGGVDIADQLRSSYTSHLVLFRTWMSLFFWIVDSSVTTCYFILSGIDPAWKNNHRTFRMQLACGLIRSGVQTTTSRNSSTGENHLVDISVSRLAATGGYVTTHRADQAIVMDANVLHLPVRVSANERRVCFYCRLMAKGRKTTGKGPRGIGMQAKKPVSSLRDVIYFFASSRTVTVSNVLTL